MKRSDLIAKLARLGIFPEIDTPDTNEARLFQTIYGNGDSPLVTADEVRGKIMALPGFDVWDAQPSDPVIVLAAKATDISTVKLIDAMLAECAPHWVPWTSGPCPVDLDQWVECLFVDGPDEPECELIARYVTWGPRGNVRAYRCIAPPKPTRGPQS